MTLNQNRNPLIGEHEDPRVGFVFMHNQRQGLFGIVVDAKPNGHYGIVDPRGVLKISVKNLSGIDSIMWAKASEWRLV